MHRSKKGGLLSHKPHQPSRARSKREKRVVHLVLIALLWTGAAVALWLCRHSYGCVCNCSGVVVHMAAGLCCFSCIWMIAQNCNGSDPCCACDMHQSFQASDANFPCNSSLNQRKTNICLCCSVLLYFFIFIFMNKMLISPTALCLGGCTVPVGSAPASISFGAKPPMAAKPAVRGNSCPCTG